MFLEEVEKFSKVFKGIIKEKNVAIISHLDCDGITSASIIVRMLLRERKSFKLRIIKQLTAKELEKMDFDEKTVLLFLDLGSGQLDLMEKILEKTQVFVLDHHQPKDFSHLNLFHLNPIIFGEEEVSTSIISYLFAKFFDSRNSEVIDLAIVGAMGDLLDEKWELKGLARKVLEEAKTIGKIKVTKGLRIYGRNTRPIHKALEFSFDPYIPGISGSESNAVQFLSEIGIPLKENGRWRKLKDLSLEEQKRLASAILAERLKLENAEDIFGEVYNLVERPEEIKDAREFATLINACGRLGKAEVAIKVCLGDKKALEEALRIFEEYRKEISRILSWIKEEKPIVKKEHANYLIAKDKIPDTLIGTITSILLNSSLVESKPLFGLAYCEDLVKISARIPKSFNSLNLKEIIRISTSQLEGEGGGHKKAAGGLIPKGKEEKFIEIIEKLLGEKLGKKS
ncbi:MAG: DHH family phosphoesterase [Candidatus Aenigmarchaeota archaeon]|nr:DHH family phosphoesterase [Candidatus Aenigmarchaeota archaeon]